MERIGEDSNSILGNSTGSFPRPCRMTGYAEVTELLPVCGLYSRNVPAANGTCHYALCFSQQRTCQPALIGHAAKGDAVPCPEGVARNAARIPQDLPQRIN